LEGHVRDPELPVVWLTEKKSLVVAGGLWAMGVQLGCPVNLDLRRPAFSLLLRHLGRRIWLPFVTIWCIQYGGGPVEPAGAKATR
jgi:hypothetical protein